MLYSTHFASLLICVFLFPPTTLFAQEQDTEKLTQAQRDSLIEKLQAIEQGFISAREARHAAAFEAFEKVINNDLALYNFYKECVERLDYSEEDSDTSKKYEQWERSFDEQIDRQDFANMLRYQIRWLYLLKKAERLIRTAEDSGMQLELELAPEVITICKEVFTKSDEFGNHFFDLQKSALTSPMARAYGLEDLETGIIPKAPLQYEAAFRSLVIAPARKNQDVPTLITGWNQLIQAKQEYLHIQFELDKKRKNKNSNRGRNNNQEERLGRFEQSMKYENFRKVQVPKLVWSRELDRFKAGEEVQATTNLYNLILSNPEHPSFRNWVNNLQKLMEESTKKAAQEEAKQETENRKEN